MSRNRIIAVADRAAPLALKLIAVGNLLFLGSFLTFLATASEMARL
jgi:hypothetical protein